MREGVRVRVLGAFELEGVAPQRLGSRKARLLLKVLALARGAPVTVDRIADVLWGDEPPGRPPDQVAVLVSRMRAVLGHDRITRNDKGYALAVDWLDLGAAEGLVEEARRRLAADSPASACAAAEGATALLRGPLLSDEPEQDWLAADRAAAERLAGAARRLRAAAALAAGDVATAVDAAERALDHDPYDEEALRVGMAALAAAGRRASALALHERIRERISGDLGVDPSPETAAAHLAVLQGRAVPGVAVGEPSRLGPGDRRSEGPLPGRDPEIAALDAALDAARSEGFGMLAVEGEAGIGKTRLLEAWSARVRAGVGALLAGRCDELGRSLPLQAVFDALTAHLRALGGPAAGALLGADGPLLAPLLGIDGDGSGQAVLPPAAFAAPADPGSRQALLFAALAGVLERAGGGLPTVLVIDDLHLAGRATAEWLRFLQRRPPRGPVLVVVSRRPGEGPALDVPATVALGPLDLAAAEALVGTEAAPALLERSGGNPLFLVELARAPRGEGLPASLLESVADRCDRMGPPARTLRTAAVLGPDVDLELLAAVLATPAAVLLDHLEEGVRRHVLEVRGSAFAFRHALLREALVAGTGTPRRALLHREAARALAMRPGADPAAVAYHARLGGDEERESAALVEAARIAARRCDHAEAGRLLDRAVTLRPSPDTLLERARLRVLVGAYAEAASDASAALAAGAGAPALEVAGFAAYYRRDFATARGLAEQGLALTTDARLRAALLLLCGRERHSVGELADAERLMEESGRAAASAGFSLPPAWLGLLRVHQGRPDGALALLTAPGAPGDLGAHLFTAIHVHFTSALALGSLGRCEEALAALDALAAEVERQQAVRYSGRGDNVRGWLLRNLGALGEADECNRRGLEAARAVGYVEAQAHALLDLAQGRLDAGDPDAARSLLEQMTPLLGAPQALAWRYGMRRRLVSGRVALVCGDAPAALAAAADVVEEADRLGVDKYAVTARLLAARAAAASGGQVDLDEVERLLARLERSAALEAWWMTAEAARDLGAARWWALAERRAAVLAGRAGDRGDAFRRHASRRLAEMRAPARA